MNSKEKHEDQCLSRRSGILKQQIEAVGWFGSANHVSGLNGGGVFNYPRDNRIYAHIARLVCT